MTFALLPNKTGSISCRAGKGVIIWLFFIRPMISFNTFTKKRKLGYASGIFTESLLYNMFYTYFLTFLVQVVGIAPAISGIVIFVSIVWDAVTDPVIGFLSDQPGIDKRKILRSAIIPLGIVFSITWLNWKSILGLDSNAATVIIYIVLAMCIWLFYTIYTIPYYAVVAEITQDYDERTSIRSLSSLLNAVAVALGNAAPALVMTAVFGHMVTYFDVSVVLVIVSVILGFTAHASLKGLYLEKAEQQRIKTGHAAALRHTFEGFNEILKLKPFKFFAMFVFFFLFATSMIQSSFTYAVVYCIGMPYDIGIVVIVVSLVLAMALIAPLAGKIAEKKDRRTSAIIFISICCIGLFILRITGLGVAIAGIHIMAVILPLVCAIGLGAFWTLFYSMAYDFVEIDEYVNGSRRESLITSVPQFIQKTGSGTGILTQGLLLSLYGYVRTSDDYGNIFSPVNDPRIISGMTNISTLFPAMLLVLSVIGLICLKTTRNNMSELARALEKRRNGEKPSEDSLSDLL